VYYFAAVAAHQSSFSLLFLFHITYGSDRSNIPVLVVFIIIAIRVCIAFFRFIRLPVFHTKHTIIPLDHLPLSHSDTTHTQSHTTHKRMLIIPLKVPVKTDLKAPLVAWLDAPPDYELFANPMAFTCLKPSFTSAHCYKDVTRLASLRNCLADAIMKPMSHRHALDDMALSDLHEYHAVLRIFQSHAFPTFDEDSPLQLTWKAAVGPQQESHGSLIWDSVCTLWNIAALESFLGSQCGTDKKEERKQAVKHYQNAASTMHHLREAMKGQCFETVDMSGALLEFWERAMLGCAQMAAYEMVLKGEDPPKHALLSYLAMGAVPVFNEALVLSKDPLLVSNLPKPILEWGARCKYWSMILTAKAEYHQAVAARQASDWGTEIMRLDQALKSLLSCKEFADSVEELSDVMREVNALIALVKDRKAQADKDNRDFMYGDAQIGGTLPPIRQQLLAKADLPMPETMTIPKVPLFTGVPAS